ncbi:MAG: peroxidase family protein [Salinarimonas sp.]
MQHGSSTWHRGLAVPKGRYQDSGRFTRKFAHLRSLKSFTLKDAEALGESGGIMEDTLGPNGDNPAIPAGFTFFGQFVDHDVTFDPTSHLEQQNDPQAIHNFRTPMLELDSVYGSGPGASPWLYDRRKPGYFLIDEGAPHDIPRNSQQRALIGDPRNDENVIVSQIHLMFLKYHNVIMDNVTRSFEQAQTLVRWHYQWIVLNEYLRLICGDEAVNAALERPTPCATDFAMPVEFAVAAFRFGHSQVRARYALNANTVRDLFPDDPNAPRVPGTGGTASDECPPPSAAPPGDLRGGCRLHPEMEVDMLRFFGSSAQPSRKIDTKIVSPLLNLPSSVVADPKDGEAERSLVTRNLKRGISFGLPSGEAIAAHYGIPALTPEEVGDIPGGGDGTPLFFYILKEAELHGKGERLAGVGARIVAETFVDMLKMDYASFLASAPDWKPTLESTLGEGTYGMVDIAHQAARWEP